MAPEDDLLREIGLYLHIPFCARKCPYCDFNTYAGLDELHGAYVDALCREIRLWAPRVQDRVVRTIFLGGGTPTLLAPAQLGRILDEARAALRVAPDAEVTSEANPGTVDRETFAALRASGVNRLSIGVQSFQAAELDFLGRIHGTEDVARAFASARDAGFDNVSLDFMFGLPGQPDEAWADSLDRAIALGPEHLSLYSLIVEPGTPLYDQVHRGQVPAPDDDRAAAQYEHAMRRLAEAGYRHYEVSNWAREGRTCAHNLVYWRNRDYLGVGAGAHGHLRRAPWPEGERADRRWGNRRPVPGYLRDLAAPRLPVASHEDLTPRQAMGETMMLGLRLLQEGVTEEGFRRLHGRSLDGAFGDRMARLQGAGLLARDARGVRLTARGLMVGNRVFGAFLDEDDAL